MEQRPLVTVLVCTYNRSALLRHTLLELIKQEADFPFDILVVDNNSNDDTRQVVEEIRRICPVPLGYCLEREQGIVYARNRGAKEARGEYIAYIDDDAVPGRDWLKNIVNAFESQIPKPACVVGKVELEWEKGRSKWFPKIYETMLGKYDFGNEPKFLGEEDYLITVNATFDKKTFFSIGKFKPYLGRRGKCLLSGEDNDIFHRLYKAGVKIYYNPNQLVYHFVPKERQKVSWLIKRVFWDGATQVLLDMEEKVFSKISLVQRILYDGKIALKNFIISLCFCIFMKKGEQLRHFLEGILKIGRVYMEFLFIFSSHYKKIWQSSKIIHQV